MSILNKITAYKTMEVAAKKLAFPITQWEHSSYSQRECISMTAALRTSNTGIIAEHKRRSPSKSIINEKVLLPEVVTGYEAAGVSAISVLTDTNFFGGSLEDLLLARQSVSIPLLRKEFIIDPYQIYESKAHGADAILLIAACLTSKQLIEFTAVAKGLGLEILLEVHNEEELNRSIAAGAHMMGVNNRDLNTFQVSLETSKNLAAQIPNEVIKVSESGIASIEAIRELRPFGYKGFLMGEHFMKTTHPGASATNFISQLA